MRKVVLNLAVSLDGFIARKDGRVDWLDNLDTGGSDLGFTAFLESCDTILTGRTSYEESIKLGNGEWPFLNMKTYVFTRGSYADKSNVFFTSDNPYNIVNTLRDEDGKDIWLFGGASFIASMRELNLVDEYIITTIPVMIGEGIKLFDDVFSSNELELIEVSSMKSIVQSHYKVVKKSK